MTALGILWFILVTVLIIGYFALDGFDLGVGMLFPILGKNKTDKDRMVQAVGPVWDGNEVWLLTAGGALFAAFAPAYATSFSGFYLAIMLVLFGLILRAVSLEFRAHAEEGSVKIWEGAFFIGSLLPALLFGVALGNVLEGIELDALGNYIGGFFALLNPFALVCGVLGLVHMLLQGSAWLAFKMPAGSEIRAKAVSLRSKFAIADIVVFVLASIMYFTMVLPYAAVDVRPTGIAIIGVVLYGVSIIAILIMSKDDVKKDFLHPILCGVGCAGLVIAVMASMFPVLIPATIAEYSITIANAASSETCLTAMTIIACIGVPIVLIYHIIVYRVFRHRVA